MRGLVRGALVLAGVAAAAWASSLALVLVASRSPELRSADAILVLGAAQWNGRPSPVLRARLEHALALYEQGLAPTVVLTGGVGEGDTVSEGEVARRYMRDAGVPESALLVERRGLTSAESMGAAAALMRERGLRSALLVSDPFHMLRLEALARRAGIDGLRAPVPASPIAKGGRLHWRYVLRESVLAPAALVVGPSEDETENEPTKERTTP